MMSKLVISALLGLAFAGCAVAYPNFWANGDAPSCMALPMSAKACHKAPKGMDATTTIAIYPTAGAAKPQTKACAGKPYNVMITFPDRRLAYVYLSSGSRVLTSSVSSQRCPTSFVFAPTNGVRPSNKLSAIGVAPTSGSWSIQVASATGSCAPFQLARASIPVVAC